MGDFGDDFDMDDLIEEDAGFGAGDADEEDMMKMMEEENFTAAKASTQTTGATGGTGAVPAASSPAAGADDDDLDWLAQAGATQTQGEGTVHRKNGDGDDDDASEDEDEALLFAGYEPPLWLPRARGRARALRVGYRGRRRRCDLGGRQEGVRARRAEPQARRLSVRLSVWRHARLAAELGGVVRQKFPAGRVHRLDAGPHRGAPARRGARGGGEAQAGRRARARGRPRAGQGGWIEEKRAAVDAELCGGKSNGLWVDAHAPRHFTELLSAENVNREVLHWLKAWDGVVFNRAPPARARRALFLRGRGSRRRRGRRALRRRARRRGAAAVAAAAATARLRDWTLIGCRPRTTRTCLWTRTGAPAQKILLLSGPPGVGKTTLAHVAARGTPGTAWWR